MNTAIRRMTLAACAIVGLGVLATQPATAAPTATNNHCVKNLDSGELRCYQSYAEVLGLEKGMSTQSTAAIYHLATFYEWINLNPGGGTFTVSRGAPCTVSTGNIDHQDPTLVDEGWNDRASSVETFNHCDIQFFKDIEYRNPCSGGYIDRSLHLGNQGCYNLPSSWRMS